MVSIHSEELQTKLNMVQASGSEIEELLFKNDRTSFVVLMQEFDNLAVEMIKNLKIDIEQKYFLCENFNF